MPRIITARSLHTQARAIARAIFLCAFMPALCVKALAAPTDIGAAIRAGHLEEKVFLAVRAEGEQCEALRFPADAPDCFVEALKLRISL